MLNEPNLFAEPTGRRSADHALSLLSPIAPTGHPEANYRYAQCTLAAAAHTDVYSESSDTETKFAIAGLQVAAKQGHERALRLLTAMQLGHGRRHSDGPRPPQGLAPRSRLVVTATMCTVAAPLYPT
jgi:hypothetical protein